MSGHVSRLPSRSACSTSGRIRSKKCVASDGSVPVNGSLWARMLRDTPLRGSRNQNRSCSIASGSPVASARSIRSVHLPPSG